MTMAGVRIAISKSPMPPTMTAVFRSWTCAEGLACQVVGNASRMGMCFVKSR